MSVIIATTRPASRDTVTKLEEEFGVNLPESYALFLNDHDGAKPEENVFSIGEANSSGVDQFIPASESIALRDLVEGFPKNALPIARASGNFVYLDPVSGAVYFWDHENDSGDIKLADSFDAFLAALKPLDVAEVRLKPGQVKKVWVKPGFRPKF